MAKSITCPICSKTSHHPDDVELGYCGNCHAFTRDCFVRGCPEPVQHVMGSLGACAPHHEEFSEI